MISSAIQLHESWLPQTENALEATEEKINAPIGSARAAAVEVQENVTIELKLAEVRRQAIKLLRTRRSPQAPAGSSCGTPASSPAAAAASILQSQSSSEDLKDAKGKIEELQKELAKAEADLKEWQANDSNGPAEELERLEKSVKDKSAEITAQQDKLKESQDGVASHSPVSGVRAANLANADAVSEVTNLLRSCGQDAKVALRKFVASFAHVENEQPSGECQLGKNPPCRSYRSLIHISEFDSIKSKLMNVQSKEGIQHLREEYKPFKSTIQDLLAMGKAAATRLDACVAAAWKELEIQRRGEHGRKQTAHTRMHRQLRLR